MGKPLSMRTPSGFYAIPATIAALLAVAGAFEVAPHVFRDGSSRAVLVDTSPSAEPPARADLTGTPVPDSNLGGAMMAVAGGGAERLLLVTDGCDIHGIEPVVPAIPVDVHLLHRRDDPALLELRPPERIASATPFAVRVRVGRTKGPGEALLPLEVVLERDGARIGAPRRLALARGQARWLTFVDRVDEPGLVRYRASLAGAPGMPENDSILAVARIGDRPLVLVVGEGWLGEGFEILQTAPGALADRLADKEVARRVDVIVLARGSSLDRRAQTAVARAVADGTGLVALQATGYAGKPLESVLPLTDAPPSGRAVCLLLDLSGSMEPWKGDLLEAAHELRNLLTPKDRVAAVVFRGAVVTSTGWVRPSALDLKTLGEVRATGETRLLPAIEKANSLMESAAGAHRRVFVISDGQWRDGGAGLAEVKRIIGTWKGADVRGAVIFVGRDHSKDALEVFAENIETSELAATLRAEELRSPDRFLAGPLESERVAAPSWLGETPDWGACRDIDRLYPRGVGERLVIRADDVPLLAVWRPAGRVAAITPRFAQNPRVAASVDLIVRACSRPHSAERSRIKVRRVGTALRIEVSGPEKADRCFVGDVSVPLKPAGPNRYAAFLRTSPIGSVIVRWGGTAIVLSPLVGAEFMGLTNCPEIAASIAARTGGTLTIEGESEPVAASAPHPAAELPLLLALIFVLGSAALRRRA